MGRNRNWTKEEIEYLQESWGTYTTAAIARKLKRTIVAIKIKSVRLGLGAQIQSSEYISLIDLSRAFNKEYSGIIQIWVKNNGLQIKQKKFVEKQTFKVIKPKDFWKWAEKNKGLINFAKYERYSLPDEPEWLKEKISADYQTQDKSRISKHWTKSDEESLWFMYSSGKYTISHIAKALNRTENAVKRRAYDLGYITNFIRLKAQKYSEAEVEKLYDLAKRGFNLKAMAKALNRSENSVRGKLERMGYNFKTCTFGEVPNWNNTRAVRRRQQREAQRAM